ncbi:hypothetical protein Sjap_014867 [Stephania japonica]|uniref:peptidylprolyl isomerase n=1 Tax=Stephania japonica TaxID=461633 RepID=A0AAP0IIV7_9MAGN
MASFFSSPTFLSHPVLPRTHTLFSSPSDTPNPPSTPTPKPQSLQTPSTEQPTPLTMSSDVDKLKKPNNESKSKVESTDWIASTLTRRFGLGAGLAWAAFLAVGVVSEQFKTRFEVSQQEANTREIEKEEEVVLPNGISYLDLICTMRLRVGGGSSPRPGDLVVIDLKGKVEGSGEVFVNTFEGEQKKPLALVMGSRPYTKGMCEGIEYVLKSMRAGGKRRVVVPPSLGFGNKVQI